MDHRHLRHEALVREPSEGPFLWNGLRESLQCSGIESSESLEAISSTRSLHSAIRPLP